MALGGGAAWLFTQSRLATDESELVLWWRGPSSLTTTTAAARNSEQKYRMKRDKLWDTTSLGLSMASVNLPLSTLSFHTHTLKDARVQSEEDAGRTDASVAGSRTTERRAELTMVRRL
ncbi:hypothetical protein CBL_12384 [Carabus blaptoides fortunei]